MFKVDSKNTRITLLTSWCFYYQLWLYFAPSSSVSVVNFEQVNVNWEVYFEDWKRRKIRGASQNCIEGQGIFIHVIIFVTNSPGTKLCLTMLCINQFPIERKKLRLLEKMCICGKKLRLILSALPFCFNGTEYVGRTCFRSSHRRCSIKKGIFKDFAKFTEKSLYQGLFFNRVQG